MTQLSRVIFPLALVVLLIGPLAATADDDGFKPIFDGKSLDGWDGNPVFWRVENGTIVGETTKEKPTKGNTFLIWRNGEPADFELKLEYKLRNHNSGVQYRSFENVEKFGRWVIGGYQADIAETLKYHGILYGEKFRGILAQRGEKTVIGKNHKPKVVGKVGDSQELLSKIKQGDWNEYHIIAKGNHFIQKINDVVMVEVTDNDEQMRRKAGLIALQLHAGPPMKVEFKNIRLKQSLGTLAGVAWAANVKKKKIALIAGPKSHGYGAHEHNAGFLLLAKCLNESGLPIEAVVYQNGWPADPKVLDDVDAVAVFSDGGPGHPIIPHIKEVEKLMKKGVGLACLHYGVEVPPGEAGDRLKDWTGGYFETWWSVNPHWEAKFKKFPNHPVARGVKPFFMDDEWYYHMRFVDDMKGVTPILSAVPPESTLTRKDGPHSNNPHVRAEKGQPQHVAWARERPDGGRGFGFTGGHWHWSWASDSFRTVVLNGLAWVAGVEIPVAGVPSKRPTLEELKANQDYGAKSGFDYGKIEKLIEEWNK